MYSCLSNQLALLMMLEARGEITTRELSLSLGITERAVHRILKDLADHDLISDRPVGHPAFPWLTVADLLAPIRDRLERNTVDMVSARQEMALAV
jgi:predicted ArsR family transcriptional regulator